MYESKCGIEETIRAIKRVFHLINKNNFQITVNNLKITIIPLCNCYKGKNYKSWADFIEYLGLAQKKLRKNKKTLYFGHLRISPLKTSWKKFNFCFKKYKEYKLSIYFDNSDAIIFYTTERLPRGDYTDSLYNKTRAIREFFENTTYARTANYTNIIQKINELIVELKLNSKKKIKEAIKDFVTNFNKITYLEKFTYQDFHAKGHCTLRALNEKIKEILKQKCNKNQNSIIKIDGEIIKYYEEREIHDIASIVSVNPKRFEKLKILLFDDNEEVENDIEKIINLLPDSSEIYLTESNEYKNFLYQNDFIKSLYKCDAKLKLKKINGQKQNGNFEEINLFNGNEYHKFQFDYVIVDLLLGPYNEGNKIIRELVKFRDAINRDKKHYEKSFFFILTLSMSDDVEDIFRAFNEGALGYVWKFSRIFSLPYIIGLLEPARQALKNGLAITAHSHSRNFSKLYHLPPRIEWKLRTEPFLQPLEIKNKKEIKEIDEISKKIAKNWIKELPKAELHYHLGGSMDEDIIFYLSANTVAHLCDKKKNGDFPLSEIINVIEEIIEKSKNGNADDFYKKIFGKFYECCKQLIDKLNKNDNCKEFNERKYPIKQWLLQLSNTKENIKEYIEKFKDKPAELWFDFLTFKVNEQGIKVNKSDLIAIFIVYVGILEGRTIESAKEFWKSIQQKLKELNSLEIKEFKNIIDTSRIKNLFNLEDGNNSLPILKIINFPNNFKKSYNSNKNSKNILRGLVRAPEDAKTLNQLLRGDVFFGADNLQYYENIFACVWYLIEKAIEDNIRYLEIRVSPSGYTKKQLTINEAVTALFEGADFCSLYYYFIKGKFIWTNFITTAKRHKTPYERSIEIGLAVTYSKRDESINKLEKDLKILPNLNYKWKASRIVGVDLAGYEEKFPPKLFVNDFNPIFKICSFVTIHAGEETPPEYIWEAVYELHTNRIGHGLSIINHPSLMNLARDLQICLELCPSSNAITNNLTGDRISKYPLYKFLKEGLNVTINTDDCATTGKSLSDEYVTAAELFYFSDYNRLEVKKGSYKNIPMTKWEILRLVKAGFDNAFINREEKSELLRSVEEEIYQKILQIYEVEPVYLIDKN